MNKFLAIVKQDGGVIQKSQGFNAAEDATAHIAKYGGFVVSTLLPGDADEDPQYILEENTDYLIVDPVTETISVDTTAKTASEDARAMEDIRTKRDGLLAETDWWGASDQTMTDAQTAYRTALRDYPATFTADNSSAWPTKP